MESGESSCVYVPADISLTHSQTELLRLLQTLVGFIDEIPKVQKLQEFHAIVRQLCEKAPEAAQALATTIQETNIIIGNSLQHERVVVDKKTRRAKGKLVSSANDPSYRPPHMAKVKAAGTSSSSISRLPTKGSEIQVDCSSKNTAAYGIPYPVLDIGDIISPDKTAGSNPEARNKGIDAPQGEPSSEPGMRPCIVENEPFPEREHTADLRAPNKTTVSQDMEGSVETTEVTSISNMSENKQPSGLFQAMAQCSPTPSPQADIAPATPKKLREGQQVSPETEEIHRAEISRSLQSTSPSPGSITRSSSAEVAPIIDIILDVGRLIHRLSQYPRGVPQDIHLEILGTLRADHQQTPITSSSNQWSDGSVWMKVLEIGSSENQKVTILNMLEYMGAWEWYDKEIKRAQANVLTKKKKGVGRRGAATHVLTQMQDIGNAPLGRYISGAGRVALGEAEVELPPESRHVNIIEQDRKQQRKRISTQLSRGQRLSTKLVKGLGPGILFSPDIWEYTKMSVEQLDVLIEQFQADAKRMKLLEILSQQLEQLVREGRTDIHVFCNTLKKERLVSEEDFRHLRATFALDGDSLQEGILEAAVNQLVEAVSTQVLGKRALEDNDSVAFNDGPELPCKIFDKLRKGQRFDAWTILAAMEISDKPSFVRYGYSVPLDEIGKHRKMRAIATPLAGWSRKVAEFRREAEERPEDATRLVYFCPLNHKNNHFTLLEINEQKEMIRHYDSKACPGITRQDPKPTRVERLVQEAFGHLGYAFSEATTPLQSDAWSCGIRVVWNFRRLVYNLPIGQWHDPQDSERMKLELVAGLLACVKSNAMRSGKRRKT